MVFEAKIDGVLNFKKGISKELFYSLEEKYIVSFGYEYEVYTYELEDSDCFTSRVVVRFGSSANYKGRTITDNLKALTPYLDCDFLNELDFSSEDGDVWRLKLKDTTWYRIKGRIVFDGEPVAI